MRTFVTPKGTKGIELSIEEYEDSLTGGKERNKQSRKAKQKDGAVGDSVKIDLLGASGEKAAHLFYGLEWETYRTENFSDPDFGLVNFKTVEGFHKKLLVQKKDNPFQIYILIIKEPNSRRFYFRGWQHGYKVKVAEFWNYKQLEPAAYLYPQEKLHSFTFSDEEKRIMGLLLR